MAERARERTGVAAVMQGRLAGLVLLAGGAAYAVAVGVLDAPFAATPLAVGLNATAAGLVSGQVRLVVIGLALDGWGAAVLLVDQDVGPSGRSAATYSLGLAVGLLVAALLARRTGAGLGGALCSGAVVAAAAYLAPDLDLLGRWETWAVALVLWAAWEARPGRTASATAGGTPRPSP